MCRTMRNILLAGAALVLPALCQPGNAVAQEADAWQFELTLYGWYAGVDSTVQFPAGPGSGADVSVNASDLLANLNMIFMGGFQAKKNRWSLVTDLIYMDVGDDADRTLRLGPPPGLPVNASVDLNLSTWIVSGGVGYDLVQADRGTLTLVGGVRYLTADVDVTTGLNGPLPFPGPAREVSDSANLLDGIVGLRGFINLNENWYVPYHFDIGTGDSDLTWQAFAGVGYRFGWGDVRLGYRYLKYNQDSDKILQDLELSGPVLGVGFRF